jgi:hypothetical protein
MPGGNVSNLSPTTMAIKTGTGSVSSTQYQKVYATLSSAPGQPGFGTGGYNDLICRANTSGLIYGIVCRFYANGVVKIFYRLNGWETAPDNPPAPFLLATKNFVNRPTTGSLLEFYAGNKASGSPTALTGKHNTESITATIPQSVLNSMGNGWGFGMGHGLSFAAVQNSGGLIYWGAEDQA